MLRAAVVCARGERAPNWESNADDDSAMQAITELSRQIAHDVRTPLNALLGFSSMLSQELFGPLGNDRYREYAGHIADSAHQTVQAAERTIALAALTPQFSPRSPKSFVNLRSLVLDSVSEAVADAPSNSRPLTQTPSTLANAICDSIDVWADQKMFQQAIGHALSGARHLGASELRLETNSERPFVRLEIHFSAESGDPEAIEPADQLCRDGNARIQFLFAQTLFRLAGALVQFGETSDTSWRFLVQLEASEQEAFAIG